MNINTDINILGGLPDWSLIEYYYDIKYELQSGREETTLKTAKSLKRFKKAINETFISFKNEKFKIIFDSLIRSEGISKDFLYLLFWNASVNNELLHAINMNVYFEAFYSGRAALRNDEVSSYLNELKRTEPQLQKWTLSTINTTASKYLTLLKKFGLLEGKQTKSILHPFLNDKMFIVFIYWLTAIEKGKNLLKSEWLKYGFMETELFLERLKKKSFTDYFNIYYTGDNLKIEPKIEYERLYESITGN